MNREIVAALSESVRARLKADPPSYDLDWSVFMTMLPNPSAPGGVISVPVLHVATPTVTAERYWHSRTVMMPPGVTEERVGEALAEGVGALNAALDRERAGEPLEKVVDLAWGRA